MEIRRDHHGSCVKPEGEELRGWERSPTLRTTALHLRIFMSPENPRPPFPPFTAETAAQKVRLAEDAWNTRSPEKVSLAYTAESVWRNRAEFLKGRETIVQFL